jgi:hypothetical protein
MTDQTREAQYQFLLELTRTEGLQSLGLMSSQVWRDDPRRLAFLLARYKFVAKMFHGLQAVVEIGCADAFGTRLVRQEVPRVVATDFDPVFIRHNQQHASSVWPLEFKVHDLVAAPMPERFDGAFCLDVIEHIPPADELSFVRHLAGSLHEHGAAIVGTPSIQSQAYASPPSKAGHVNCKDGEGLRTLLLRVFHNVFVFSMNDEVVHTGFQPMAHYLLALAVSPRPQ